MANPILTINALLEEAGVDLAVTRFVRHADPGRVPDMLGAWLHRRADFERYQAIQSRPVFDNTEHVASFVVSREGETIFVGLYTVRGRSPVPAGVEERLTGTPSAAGCLLYDMQLSDRLVAYAGRLVVDWGPSPRAWVQRPNRVAAKAILELRSRVSEPPFPGCQRFTCDLASVPRLPLAWRTVLAAVHGCYVLTHKPSGQLYVGAAYGSEGFYGRWLDHATRPDPVGLRGIQPDDFQVSILEVTDSTAGVEPALRAEAHWKRALRPSLNGDGARSGEDHDSPGVGACIGHAAPEPYRRSHVAASRPVTLPG